MFNMPYPAATPAPPVDQVVTDPSRGGWLVSLGAFATRQNAEVLLGRVGAQRYQGQALPIQIQDSRVDGRNLYRVRVGPYPSRDEADRVARFIVLQSGVDTVRVVQNR
ncbi:MAG: SPOR domain-containing protein [Magnetococcus sp. WYHC-3]